ncbi:MAG: hypothetical protein RLP02_10505 [Coleofasciculus sp. C2-GNP5-27]
MRPYENPTITRTMSPIYLTANPQTTRVITIFPKPCDRLSYFKLSQK